MSKVLGLTAAINPTRTAGIPLGIQQRESGYKRLCLCFR